MSNDYLSGVMRRLSNTLHNASQSDYVTKDEVLNSIKWMLEDYQERSGDTTIQICDYRDRFKNKNGGF